MEFYGKVFGWRFQKFAGPMEYWSILTSSSGSTASGSPAEYGIDGGLLKRRDPAQPRVTTVDVADLDQSVATVLANGGSIALPKMPVPEIGWLAYCKDLDGHIFGMMQSDSAAK